MSTEGNAEIYKRSPIGTFTKEHLIEYTSDWKGERFPDGRPKVPDDIIERMKGVTLTQAWSSCKELNTSISLKAGLLARIRRGFYAVGL